MYNLNLIGINKILNSQKKLKSIILLSTISVYGEINKKIISLRSKKKTCFMVSQS